ncbi:biliverdin-producing heme oxygenase [Pseudomonas sp. 22-AL-CL-001]|jgi:heme oxygenase|uniref:biliverdin-producing heme oxygenase n=1 Tax=Pseudomonas alabamensis TaxID=3064349 RepID=UPI002713671A|nr:biliverdin-producing heme oxygenase [Pseudomonas sp. 22-AL-CL-001]MDO7910888.1 biliverdin-producing heme oxygenase [Pseudomonas sp. 22-AL-CL-001]
MNAPAPSPSAPGRCKRLKAASSSEHDTVDQLVMSVRPFDDRERYVRFLTVQHRFHGSLQALYSDPSLNRRLPGLALLSRFDAVQQDLRDLGVTVPPAPEPVDATVAQALGWLYCSEGSNLGAAFLFKQTQRLGLDAERGARHLAPHPDGRALHWREFVAALDGLDLSDAQEAHAIEGAIAAFDSYRRHVREVFELEAVTA